MAADASERFPDGVWWVPLATLRDPALLFPAVAQALDVREQPGRPLVDVLGEQLGRKHPLIVLDNVEQLLPEAADGIGQLRELGSATILLTSRELWGAKIVFTTRKTAVLQV